MKYIAIMDTSVMSFNVGDQIIMESARKQLHEITKDAFVVNMPTHSPLFHAYEFSLKHRDSFTLNLNKIDLKFVCGTNLLEKDMFKRKNTWNIKKSDTRYFNDFILVGVGTDGLKKTANNYTKKLYDKALSHSYKHSVRDVKTKKYLESLGFEAINTGCPTTWSLTPELCKTIPTKKSDTVIFTVTDYMPDVKNDKKMIEILCRNYENIYCWIQGSQDIEYLKKLGIKEGTHGIKYVSPSLEAYNEFLDTHDTDYIGTRLHAGIKATQKAKRSIIIGVDNRAKDMNVTNNFNYIDRKNIAAVEEMLQSEIITDIKINEREIKEFLSQFI